MWDKLATLSLLLLVFSLCLLGLGTWYQSINSEQPKSKKNKNVSNTNNEIGEKQSQTDSYVIQILKLLVTASLILFFATYIGAFFHDRT